MDGSAHPASIQEDENDGLPIIDRYRHLTRNLEAAHNARCWWTRHKWMTALHHVITFQNLLAQDIETWRDPHKIECALQVAIVATQSPHREILGGRNRLIHSIARACERVDALAANLARIAAGDPTEEARSTAMEIFAAMNPTFAQSGGNGRGEMRPTAPPRSPPGFWQ
jgi:hypothetical protein